MAQWFSAFAALTGNLDSSQHSPGVSQASVTPVPRDWIPYSGLHGNQAPGTCVVHTHIHADKTLKIINKKFKKIIIMFKFRYVLLIKNFTK